MTLIDFLVECKMRIQQERVVRGLIYRMLEPKVTLLVFVSGKIILSGARSRQELRDAFSNLFPILQTSASCTPR